MGAFVDSKVWASLLGQYIGSLFCTLFCLIKAFGLSRSTCAVIALSVRGVPALRRKMPVSTFGAFIRDQVVFIYRVDIICGTFSLKLKFILSERFASLAHAGDTFARHIYAPCLLLK